MDTSELDHDAILSQTLQQELDEFQKQNVSTLAKYSKQLEANGYCNNLVNRDCVLNWLVSETDCIFSKMGKIDRYFSKMNSEFEFNTFIFPTTDEYLNVLSMFDFYSFFYASKHNSNIVSHASSIVEKLLKQMEHAHRLQKVSNINIINTIFASCSSYFSNLFLFCSCYVYVCNIFWVFFSLFLFCCVIE